MTFPVVLDDAVVTDAGVGQTTVEGRFWAAAPAADIIAPRDAAIPAALAARTAAGGPLASREVLLGEGPAEDDQDTREAAADARTRRQT